MTAYQALVCDFARARSLNLPRMAKAAVASAEAAENAVKAGMADRIAAFLALAGRSGTSRYLTFPAAVTTTLPGAIGTLEEAEIRFARAYVSLELASAEEALADEALLNAEAKLLSATPAERPALQTTVAEASAWVAAALLRKSAAETTLKAADEERKRVIDAAEVAMLEAASLNGLGP